MTDLDTRLAEVERLTAIIDGLKRHVDLGHCASCHDDVKTDHGAGTPPCCDALDKTEAIAREAAVLLQRARDMIFDLEMCPSWQQEEGQALRVGEIDPFLAAHPELIA